MLNNNESRLAAAYREEAEKLTYNTAETKKRFTGRVCLITVSSILVTTLVLIAFLSALNRNSKSIRKKNKTYTNNELTEICDMLDYSAITATVRYRFDEISGVYLVDADNDGRNELFIDVFDGCYQMKNNILAFDTADNAIMSSAAHNGAAGIAELHKSIDYPLCLEWGYHSLGTTTSSYEKWSNNGWKSFAYIDGSYESDGFENSYKMHNATIDGKTISDYDEFVNKINVTDADDLSTVCNCLTTNYYSTNDPKRIITEYKNHLNKYKLNYEYLNKDFDNDGKKESLFLLKDFMSLWSDNLQTVGTDGSIMEDYIDSYFFNNGCPVILFDVCDEGVVFYTFYLYFIPDFKLATALWENNVFIVSEEHTLDISEDRFFCIPVELVCKNTDNNTESSRIIFENYIAYLKKYEDYNVVSKYCDICSAPGEEMICVLKKHNSYEINIYAIYNGQIIRIYHRDVDNNRAVYITKYKNKNILFDYAQSVATNSQDYYCFYSYCLSEFNEKYLKKILVDESISIKNSNEPTEKEKKFFDDLNSYLDNSTICYDSYQLTGYYIMPDDNSSIDQDTKYLNISNCSTNKRGTVRVNSWLNFRELPDITAQRILIDPYDPESFVKQINGSSVTVLEVANTGDTENPIWLKIRIKYSDRELIGYSSQNYIDIDGIKEMSVGESFTVKADTNDSGIIWQSSDPSVLSIDKNSGNAKALKTGMVLVTVKSVSGLADSCLIWVK